MGAALSDAATIGAAGELRGGTTVPVARENVKRGVSWVDGLTLAAIGLVVVLVSLPRLRRFALRENETDAVRMLRVLSAAIETTAPRARLSGLSQLVASRPDARRLLTDLESLPDGRVRRHGYLFDLVLDDEGQPILCAWPWEQGRTGQGAFVLTARAGLLGHANEDGAWTGPARPLTRAALEHPDAGWRAISRL